MDTVVTRWKHRKPAAGFSLVEVVLALGIISFVGLALLGLFSVGVTASKDSVEELAATHITQSLFAMRRTSPLADIQYYPLPPLDEAAELTDTAPAYLSEEGLLLPSAKDAKYALVYKITPDGLSPGTSKVYACLYWPANLPAKKSQGRYETFSILPRP